MNVIALEHVSKIYGPVYALSNVNISIEQGEMVSIMGPSGSGKTTLLNLVGCLDKPSEGVVVIDGVGIEKLPRRDLTRIKREKITGSCRLIIV